MPLRYIRQREDCTEQSIILDEIHKKKNLDTISQTDGDLNDLT